MPDLIYRDVRHDDRKALQGLYGEFVGDSSRYARGDGDSFERVIESPRAKFIVACDDSTLVGFLLCTSRDVFRYPRPIVEIEELFVLPSQRRKGVARHLMELAEAWAREQGAGTIFLASDKKRTEAHDLYRSLNYSEYAYHFRIKL